MRKQRLGYQRYFAQDQGIRIQTSLSDWREILRDTALS